MTVITSPFRLARPSAIISRSMSALERTAFSAGDFSFVADPEEIATEYVNLALRDRASGVLAHANGSTRPTFTTLNGRRAIQGNDNAGHLRASYQLPQSYFIASAFRTGTDFATTNAIISSSDQNGNRLLFGTIGTTMAILHGPTFPLTLAAPLAPNTNYVAWASFDADTMAAEIGINAVTPQTIGTLPVLHKGDMATSFFGGAGAWGFDGKFAVAVVSPRFYGGVGNEARRAGILAWLCDLVDVPLGE